MFPETEELSLTPELHDISVAPEVVILLFLPALLYWEALTTSLREIRADLRTVLLTPPPSPRSPAGSPTASSRCCARRA